MPLIDLFTIVLNYTFVAVMALGVLAFWVLLFSVAYTIYRVVKG